MFDFIHLKKYISQTVWQDSSACDIFSSRQNKSSDIHVIIWHIAAILADNPATVMKSASHTVCRLCFSQRLFSLRQTVVWGAHSCTNCHLRCFCVVWTCWWTDWILIKWLPSKYAFTSLLSLYLNTWWCITWPAAADWQWLSSPVDPQLLSH